MRDAARAGPSVPQVASRLEQVQASRVPDGNEDGSLTVNVFSPRRAPADGTARPVLVWWHGGFTSGSGGWDRYDGGHLSALGEIVVVTANYRVGPLGYLYLPEIGAANLGPQDQAHVLDRVQDNIASFGGDPHTVTVGGQSAGAYSALMLALDPATNGSVTRLLLQSGPFGLARQDAHDAAETADAHLRLLDIPAGADAATALRALPVEQLLDAYRRLSARLAVQGNAASLMYPVLGAPGVPRTRQQALADGTLAGKSLLIGTTRDQSTAFLAFDPRTRNLTAATALDLLTAQIGGQAAQHVYQRHVTRRPQATPTEIFTAVQTDGLFRDGSFQIADQHAGEGNATYVCQFGQAPAADPYALGATHCAELPYLFGTFDASPDGPILAGAGAGADGVQHALGREFASTVAEFVNAGTVADWLPYAPADGSPVRHFG
ncbi:carboxylesterase family protein [Streptomyces sp. NPDC087212]|uniref:carboxylesterase family protein n=1 Tax=Streptomyces sp. NPDC087212 TaxID=3365766 RepID=UPI00382D4376